MLRLAPLALLAALAVAPLARAGGTIDATEYFPVGAFNAWEMIDKALWNGGDGTKEEGQIIDIGKITVIGGVPRYNVRTPFFASAQAGGMIKDLILQFGTDGGVLYLYGLRVVSGADFSEDDLSVPTIFFDDPVPVGDTTTTLDANFAVTPVSAKFEVSIDIGPKEISGIVFLDGTITARWNSVPQPIVTPLGTLGDDETLAELQIDAFFTYSSPDPEIDGELQGKITQKGVRAIMGPGIGFVQIDGKGSQQKIVNRVILPGELMGNEDEPFPALPPGDLAGFSLDIAPVVTLNDGLAPTADGGISDGNLTLDGLILDHALGGALALSAQLSSVAGDGPVDLLLLGTAKINPKTGGLVVKLKGASKKLNLFEPTVFAKSIKFSCVQEIPAPFAPTDLVITWTGGKDPETKEVFTGELQVPVEPFTGNALAATFNLPVDVAKVKKGFFFINPAKRLLGAEGVLTLTSVTDGAGKVFPLVLRETASVKEGLPTGRSYALTQTGKTLKLFTMGATSTGVPEFTLFKFKGRLLGVKVAPVLPDGVEVTAQ